MGLRAGLGAQLPGTAIREYPHLRRGHLPELTEPPGYFKKEVKQSSEMNYDELRRYIADLQQSGFDVVRLRVQLQKKFAYPLITFVMAVLAVPVRAGQPDAAARWPAWPPPSASPWCTG